MKYDSLKKRSSKNFTDLRWSFADGGNNIPRSAKVSLGDVDPLTGEVIRDERLFDEYRRDMNREIENQLRNRFPTVDDRHTLARKRKQVREKIREEFLREYGYEPDPGTLKYLAEKEFPAREILSSDYYCTLESELEDETGISGEALRDRSAESAFCDAADDDIQSLREYVSTLTPLQFDVYSAMLLRYEGSGLWITDAELSEKWGIPVHVIVYERKKIISGIRKAVKEGQT